MTSDSLSSMIADMSSMSADMASMSRVLASATSAVASATITAVATYAKHAGHSHGSSSMAGMGDMDSGDMGGMDMGGGSMGGMDMGGGSMGGMDMGGHGSPSCKMEMAWNWYTIDSCFLAKGWHVRTSGQFAGTCIGVFLWGMVIVLLAVVRRKFDSHIVSNWLRKAERMTRTPDARPAAAGQCVPLGEQCEAVNQAEGEIDEIILTNEQSGRGASEKHADEDFVAKSYANGRTQSVGLSSQPSGSLASADSGHSPRGPLLGRLWPQSGSPFQAGDASVPAVIRPNLVEQVVRALLYGFQYSITSLLALILMSFNGYVIISAFLGVTIGYLLLDWPRFYGRFSNQNEHIESATPVCC